MTEETRRAERQRWMKVNFEEQSGKKELLWRRKDRRFMNLLLCKPAGDLSKQYIQIQYLLHHDFRFTMLDMRHFLVTALTLTAGLRWSTVSGNKEAGLLCVLQSGSKEDLVKILFTLPRSSISKHVDVSSPASVILHLMYDSTPLHTHKPTYTHARVRQCPEGTDALRRNGMLRSISRHNNSMTKTEWNSVGAGRQFEDRLHVSLSLPLSTQRLTKLCWPEDGAKGFSSIANQLDWNLFLCRLTHKISYKCKRSRDGFEFQKQERYINKYFLKKRK